MSRRLSLVVTTLAAAFALGGCNNPTCGPGTMQQQNKDGTIQCVAASGTSIPCDVDGGATIVGGRCVAAVQCDPNSTTEINGVCIGTGGADTPPPCPPPSSGNTICVNGLIRNLVDNSRNMTDSIHVAYYSNPLNFLHHMPADARLDTTAGSFSFADVPSPSPALPLIAVAFGDGDLESTNMGVTFVAVGAGAANVQGGKSYRVDGYVIKRSVVEGWHTQTGVDWFTKGAYLARF
jgi:hypothetical protein